jgi:hypothetical protein
LVLLTKYYSTDLIMEDEMGRKSGIGGGGTDRNCLLGRPGHRSEDNIQIYLKQDGAISTGFIYLRLGANGRLLWNR